MRTSYLKHNPPDIDLSPLHPIPNIIDHIQTAAENMEINPTHTHLTPDEYSPPPPDCYDIPNNTTETAPDDEYFLKQDLTPTPHIKAVARAMTKTNTATLPENVRVHVDGGANRSVTNNIHCLTGYRDIKKYPLNGVSGDGPAVYCTGVGYLPWKADSNATVYIKCYYSKDAAETIVSPTDVVINHLTDIHAWGQHCNIDTGKGWLKLYYRDGSSPITYNLYNKNNLWYHLGQGCTIDDLTYTINNTTPTVCRLNSHAQYELQHQRLGHPGTRVMSIAHLHIDDLPHLKPHEFYKCATCTHAKCKNRSSMTDNTHHHSSNTETPSTQHSDIECGQHFNIDFGFMRGSSFQNKDDSGRTITSIDGYRSYCLIIDRKSRYMWVFLTKTKQPPIDILDQFFAKHGHPTAKHKTIRTDEGGELWHSQAFRKVALDHGFLPEPTAAGAPFQNGMAERPNQTLGNMVRCLLHAAGLGPEYWSFAINHATYLKNRLPHTAINDTPMHIYTGKRPSAKHLRVFGCPIIVKLPGKRPAKLDLHTCSGIFLGYTATDKNIYYRDTQTHRIKITTHCTFDEAAMTIPTKDKSPSAHALHQVGITEHAPQEIEVDTSNTPTQVAQIKLQTQHAKLPTRATDGSAGYDVYSARNVLIKPGERSMIPLDFSITPPDGTYIQLHSRSGLAAKHGLDVKAGVIDADYTGNVTVILHNTGTSDYDVQIGDRIAQMVFTNITTPTIEPTQILNTTQRGDQGFGSTSGSPPPLPSARAIDGQPPPTVNLDMTPQHLYLSLDPFDKTLSIQIQVKGDHPTLGMQLSQCQARNRLQLTNMALSTPGSRIPKWRSLLRHAYLITFHNQPIHNIVDLESAVQTARKTGLITATCTFAVDKSYGIHPHQGIPQLHFDQLNTIAKHLQSISTKYAHDSTVRAIQHPSAAPSHTPPTGDPTPVMEHNTQEQPQSFTLSQLKKRPDWPEWKQAQYKMLNQYLAQGMFSDPQALPMNANALHMLWTYVLKICGTKKARMVCNGNPRQKGTVTLGHTYANSLDAASERLFWAIVAQEGLIAIGADVSNAFAEAPPPKAPLYLYIDDTFREWWTDHLGRPPIPTHCNVVRVNNAIQGHPESPRLWEKHINGILKDIGLTPATHEPCLYSGVIDNHRMFFLRQVDDFTVAATTADMAHRFITMINQRMRIELKTLGTVTRFNGMDIHQTRDYVKVSCEKYLEKMLTNHQWLDTKTLPNVPTPLPADSQYITQLEQATPPNTRHEQQQLQATMGFSYRQVVGEILYPMVKCRPDITFHITKLSQYSANPAQIHYEALRHICHYLAATYKDGIYYWRRTPRHDLPSAPLPTTNHDTYQLQIAPTSSPPGLYGYVDADWGSDTGHRKSVSGIILMYAGGAVGYKTKYQETIAHSSTEAEFTAACEAGKLILYFRSILEDLHLPQQHATILYEDNNGALLMANAQQPTRRTRHMDIKTFAILDWVEQDLLLLANIRTNDNAADTMTKALTKQLFYRHVDTIMGHRIPKQLERSNTLTTPVSPACSKTEGTCQTLQSLPLATWGG